jgi:hypothetical protein
VPIEVGEWLTSVRFPQNDVTLFSATGNLLMLEGVDEAINALEMQVKGVFWTILESLKVVHMDKAIERRGQKPHQILVVFDLCDPAPMRVHLGAFKTFFLGLILNGSLGLSFFSQSIFFLLISFIFRLLLLGTLILILASRCFSALSSSGLRIGTFGSLFKFLVENLIVLEGVF